MSSYTCPILICDAPRTLDITQQLFLVQCTIGYLALRYQAR